MIEFNNYIFAAFLPKIQRTVNQNDCQRLNRVFFKVGAFFIIFKNRLRSFNQDILTNELEQR